MHTPPQYVGIIDMFLSFQNLKWVIFTNLVSGTVYKCSVNSIECSLVACELKSICPQALFICLFHLSLSVHPSCLSVCHAANHTTTTQDITGVVASVFHPLHNNTDHTTAQISWRLANSSQSPSSYDVRIRCIRVREKQQLQPLASLEHIQVSDFTNYTLLYLLCYLCGLVDNNSLL